MKQVNIMKTGLGHALTCPRRTTNWSSGSIRPRVPVPIRASDDEDMVPILSGRRKKGFTKKEYEQLKNPKLLGGKTIGEELSMLRQEYLSAEGRAHEQSRSEFSSDNWQGDVYIGSQWNTLSVLYGIMMMSILGGLAMAYFSYGHWWGVTPGLY